MQTIGYAALQIIPSVKGIRGEVEKVLGERLKGTGVKGGQSWGGGLVGTVGKYAKRAGLIAGGLMTAKALHGGISRALNIEDARAQLSGLKLDAASVESVMKSATDAVTGTAYGLDAAATAAAGALGAGVSEGKELTRYLTLVADATTQSNTTFDRMALMMNKVQGQGKLTGGVLNQMALNGLQVMPMLTKEYGKSTAEMTKMVAEGKVSAADFARVLENQIGGAAQASGSTTRGAIANMGAAFGRLGAVVVTAALPGVKAAIGKITGAVDALTGAVGPVIEKVSEKFGDLFTGFDPSVFDPIISGVRTLWDEYGPLVERVAGVAWDVGMWALKTAVEAVVPTVRFLGEAFEWISGVLSSPIFQAVAVSITTLLLPAIIASTAALVAQGVSAAVTGAAWLAYGIAVKGMAIGAKVAAAAQWALNTALTANPIGLVIVAIAALVAGLVVAYKRSETFRKVVDKAFSFVGKVAGVMWGQVKAAFQKIMDLSTKLGSWIVRRFNDAKRGFFVLIDAARELNARIRERLGAMIDFMKGIPGRIKSAFGSAKTLLSGVGRDIMAGLRNGIDAGLRWVRDKVSGIGRMIPGWLKKVLGISSPSKVTKRLGRWVTEGLALGIFQAVGFAKKMTRKMVNRTLRAMDDETFKRVKRTVVVATKVGKRVGNALASGVIRSMPATTKAIKKWDNTTTKNLRKSQKRLLAGLRSDARERLKVLKAQMTEYANAARDAALQFAALANFQPEEGQPIDSGSLVNYLSDQGAKLRAFTANLARASQKGLSKALYDQIVQMGPEQGAAYAEALANATPGHISALNRHQAKINQYAKQLGKSTSRTMYGAGVDAAQGFVKGINKLIKRIRKAGVHMGNAVVKSLKKALGIRSPSLVMAREIGQHLLPGVFRGVEPTQRRFDRDMADAVDPSRWAGSVASARVASSIADTHDVVTGHRFPTAEEVADILAKRPPQRLVLGRREWALSVQDANNDIRRFE